MSCRFTTFRNVRLELTGQDDRSAMVFDSVERATVSQLNADLRNRSQPLLKLHNVRSVVVADTPFVKDANTFVSVGGKNSRQVLLKHNNLLNVTEPYTLYDGADPNEVISWGNLSA